MLLFAFAVAVAVAAGDFLVGVFGRRFVGLLALALGGGLAGVTVGALGALFGFGSTDPLKVRQRELTEGHLLGRTSRAEPLFDARYQAQEQEERRRTGDG